MDSSLCSTSSLPSPSTQTRPPSPPRVSAPYGQACINCAKAKCKCIISRTPSSGAGRGNSFICERCLRLGRECIPSTGVRKQRSAKPRRVGSHTDSTSTPTAHSSNTSAATRTANLEQKLEDLVAILKAQAASGNSPNTSLPSPGDLLRERGFSDDFRQDLGGSSSMAIDHGLRDASCRAISGPFAVTPATSHSHTTSPTNKSVASPPGASDIDALSPLEAEEALALFRNNFLPMFPFAYISSTMAAAELQRDRPFLWLNITALCCKSPVKQMALHQRSRDELGRKLLSNGDRDIDMLLGVLLLLGWTMHFFTGKPTQNVLMNIAMAIVGDLRLDKPIQDPNSRDVNCFKADEFRKTTAPQVQTNEHRRAVIACYIFCSCGSAFLRSQSMRWTPHMEESLQMLAANPEWEGDQLLFVMAKTRRLMETVQEITWAQGASEVDGLVQVKPPASLYVKILRQNLQHLKSQVPETVKNNRIVQTCILSVDMLITEMPFPNCFKDIYVNLTPPASAKSGVTTIDPARLENLYATFQTSKAFLDHFLGYGLSELVGVSFPVFLHFFRACQTLYRLILTEEPGWDRSVVSEGVDLVASIKLLASRFAQLPGLYRLRNDTDSEGNEVLTFYVKCAKTLNNTAPMWQSAFAQAGVGKNGSSSDAARGARDNSIAQVQNMPGPAGMLGAGLPAQHPEPSIPGQQGYILPNLFPIDFSVDDGWWNDYFVSSWDMPGQL
ncbi:hypothetical protein GGR57DRAFT_54822 [Xylariaceae sp. FL1272]|nr:hypothetical protein GGR57DRAFT_54822 [Xylariaceae sp. FL1272]